MSAYQDQLLTDLATTVTSAAEKIEQKEDYVLFTLLARHCETSPSGSSGIISMLVLTGHYQLLAEALYVELRATIEENNDPQLYYLLREVLEQLKGDLELNDSPPSDLSPPQTFH